MCRNARRYALSYARKVRLANGTDFLDEDHTFITGRIPTDWLPTITAATTPGQVPQSGVELIDETLPPVRSGIDALITEIGSLGLEMRTLLGNGIKHGGGGTVRNLDPKIQKP